MEEREETGEEEEEEEETAASAAMRLERERERERDLFVTTVLFLLQHKRTRLYNIHLRHTHTRGKKGDFIIYYLVHPNR